MPRRKPSRHDESPAAPRPGPAPAADMGVPLDQLATGASGVVRQLRGGAGAAARLAVMGFTPGTEVTVLQNRGWGPMIVMTRDVRLALGRGLAHKIELAPPPSSR